MFVKSKYMPGGEKFDCLDGNWATKIYQNHSGVPPRSMEVFNKETHECFVKYRFEEQSLSVFRKNIYILYEDNIWHVESKIRVVNENKRCPFYILTDDFKKRLLKLLM